MSWVNLVLGGINYIGSLVSGKISQFTEPTRGFSKSMTREGGGAAFETD